VPREVPNPTPDLSLVRLALGVTMLPVRVIPTVTGATLELSPRKVLENVVCARKELITPSLAPEQSASSVSLVVTLGERETPSALPVLLVMQLSSMDPPTAQRALLESTLSSPVVPLARTANPDSRTPTRDRPCVSSVHLEPLHLTLQLWSAASALLASSVLILPRLPVKCVPLEASLLWKDLLPVLSAREEVSPLMRV